MPVLDWLGKNAVTNHHNQVPYRLVHCNGSLSSGDKDSGNLLVQGDNLVALKALLPHYAGQVKCIYIDPPYNTGNEGWVYNDNVNSDTIRKWLGKVVGKDAEDLSRHDKWLCMMYPRLKLLKEFLRDDGVIFVSIDTHELHHARILLDDIFGENCHKNTIAVRRGIKSVQSQFEDIDSLSQGHEYILLYSKKPNTRLPKLTIGYELEQPGKWDTFWRGTDRPTMRYELFGVLPETGQWRWENNRTNKAVENYKKYLSLKNNEISLDEWYLDNLTSNNLKLDFVRNEDGKIQYYIPPRAGKLSSDNWMDILLTGSETEFVTEKNILLIRRIIDWITAKNDLILDSFAGSGTTGHAVLQANAEDGGNRRFILVEMDKAIAQEVTAQRLTKVIGGYFKNGDSDKPVAGLGGGFRFCRLGKPLFDEWGELIGEATFSDIAAHVFFIETGSPIPKRADGSTPFIGAFQNKAVYLLYSAENTGMPLEGSGNTLTPELLPQLTLPPECEAGSERVVYAEHCTLNAKQLQQENIIFRQIPYHLTKEGK